RPNGECLLARGARSAAALAARAGRTAQAGSTAKRGVAARGGGIRLCRRPRVLALVDPLHLDREFHAAREPRLALRYAGDMAIMAPASKRTIPPRARGGARRRGAA